MTTAKPWSDRIAEARQRGKFTADDVVLARSWVTCACGEQDQRIPRLKDTGGVTDEPVDDRLSVLGTYFFNYVTDNDIDRADKTLALIEARAAEVLRELGP